MQEYLIFHLYGPMASFGDVAVGEYRPSHAHPTKSAILGLVAGALGIQRDEEEKHHQLESALGFAVLVLSSGELLRDYHTSQVPPGGKKAYATRKEELSVEKSKLNTILSARDYRTDAHYRVAIWLKQDAASHNKKLLNEITTAMESPVFTPYLGRKSCPLAIPLQAELVKADSVTDALAQAPHKLGKYLSNIGKASSAAKKEFSIYTEQLQNSESQFAISTVKKDRVISRKRWQFGDRIEYQITTGDKDVLQ